MTDELKECLLEAMAAAYRDYNEGIPLPHWYKKADALITKLAERKVKANDN